MSSRDSGRPTAVRLLENREFQGLASVSYGVFRVLWRHDSSRTSRRTVFSGCCRALLDVISSRDFSERG